MLVLVAPGQGAQTPGMLTPWLDLSDAAEQLGWWSAVSGLDLVHYGTKAAAERIRDTAVAQPLLVAAGLVAAGALFPHQTDAHATLGAVAGHSVGELTAAAVAGALSPETVLVLVRERGRAMAAASAQTPTGMTAVLGGDPDDVLAHLDRHGLTPANVNGAGQVVAAGTISDLAAFAAEPPAGARLRPLPVAGAFHTPHMASAVDHLRALAVAAPVSDPHIRLLSSADGAVVHHGREMLNRFVAQVSSPVRWDLCLRTMADLGVTAVLELPPAGTLCGLVRRALPGVETLAVKTPADLGAARQLLSRHSAQPATPAPPWRLVVAPLAGIFRLGEVLLGAALPQGGAVGTIRSRKDEQPVTAPYGGTVVEVLVEDGDPVAPGQPLVRLHPEVAAEGALA